MGVRFFCLHQQHWTPICQATPYLPYLYIAYDDEDDAADENAAAAAGGGDDDDDDNNQAENGEFRVLAVYAFL